MAASPNHKAQSHCPKSASSACGMQTLSSKAPTVRSRDSLRKERDDAIWTAPSPIATFVRCLRLLDLDQLEDWPGISEHTFSTLSAKRNLQARIKCVEWSLYRLFELWSPSESRDVWRLGVQAKYSLTHWQKLRPFFPPLTPLQSLNLRAALYRSLTELKRNGVLGKEIVLRKTMLDECKGEKFEEVTSAFAVTVLRRTAFARKETRLELACSDRLTGQQQAQLLPLIIAHRSSLQQQLSHHHGLQGHAEAYSALLSERHNSIEKRHALFSRLPVPEGRRKADICEDIADSWMGDDRWAEILVSAPTPLKDQLLDAPFETGWIAVLNGENDDPTHETDLLEDLNARIANQEIRLRKWKTFAASLRDIQAQRKQALPTTTPLEKGNSAMLRFNRHQSLHLPDEARQTRPMEYPVPTASVHKTLLVSMKAELAGLARQKPVKSPTSREMQGTAFKSSPEEESLEPDLPERSQDLLPNGSRISPSVSVFKSGSQDSNEVAPRRFPQAMGSIQRAKSHVSGSNGALATSSGCKQYCANDTIPTEPPSIQEESEYPPKTPSSANITTYTRTALPPGRRDRGMGESTKLSAFERHETPTRQALDSLAHEQRGIHSMSRPATLLERTRESMSLLPNPAGSAGQRSSEKRASTTQSRLSMAFPINQFETPRKMPKAESLQCGTKMSRSGSLTPRDDIFSDAAGYDSVFKSRPRIALSPPLSPDRNVMGSDSMLEEELGDLTLKGDR